MEQSFLPSIAIDFQAINEIIHDRILEFSPAAIIFMHECGKKLRMKQLTKKYRQINDN